MEDEKLPPAEYLILKAAPRCSPSGAAGRLDGEEREEIGYRWRTRTETVTGMGEAGWGK